MPINIEYQSNHSVSTKICDLLNLIRKNMNILLAISMMDTKINLYKINRICIDKSKILEECLDEVELMGKITEEEAKKFHSLWDEAEIDNQLGKLLEEIIATGGPINKYEKCSYSRESKVKETEENNNFDIIFYDSDLSEQENANQKWIEIQSNSEFHECKKNVCNEIPCDESVSEFKFKKKLDFIKKVHEFAQDGLYYIPTFKYNVTGSEKFLKKNGYEFIEIINVNKIIDIYIHRGQAV